MMLWDIIRFETSLSLYLQSVYEAVFVYLLVVIQLVIGQVKVLLRANR